MSSRTCVRTLSTVLATGALLATGLAGAAAGQEQGAATFTRDVAPIFQAKCQSCHQPGSIAPMSLITYQDARPWARSIRERVSTRQMPPWHIDPSVGVRKFKNDMSLTQAQIDTIVRWVDSGAPMGDPRDMPPAKPLTTDNGWRAEKDGFGPPDLVVRSDDYTMPAQHQDVWWRPMSDIPVTEPRWVRMVEIRPTTMPARKIVHHAIAYHVLSPANTAEVNTGIGSFGNSSADDLVNRRPQLMEWAIGKGYDRYLEGTGKMVMPGEKISWDEHLHAVGEEITGGVEIGLWFYPKGQEPAKHSYLVGFTGIKRGLPGQAALDIPPNSIAQTEGFTVLKENTIITNFQPHFHLRGKAMQVEAILPDGQTQTISYVGNFNFNWMTNYIYADDAAPVFPKGTIIHVIAWYDNTRANKNNPDPDQWVGYGDRTVDEMAHAWMNVVYLSDQEYQDRIAKYGVGVTNGVKPTGRQTQQQ
ncbi:MAG: cytochrome c [Acidobacteria bacterium]|nr:cytochrome c [Acidobacteriota bacterium]